MHFLIQSYRRFTGKIISIVRECFNRVAFNYVLALNLGALYEHSLPIKNRNNLCRKEAWRLVLTSAFQRFPS